MTFDPINGTVIADQFALSTYYDEDSSLVNATTYKNFISPYKLELKNLLRIQTTFNAGYHDDSTGIGNIISAGGNNYIWDVSATSFLGAISDTKPSEYGVSASAPILNSSQVVKLFTNLPDEDTKRTSNAWYEITNRVNDDMAGKLSFTLKVKNVNDARGEFLTYYSQPYTFNFTINGFKSSNYTSWSKNIDKEGSNYVLNLKPDDKLQYLLFSNALVDKNYLTNFVKDTMNEYIFEYVNGIGLGTKINFEVGIDNATKSVKLTDVYLATADGISIKLPDLTITRFLSYGLDSITPVLDISTLINTFPSYYADNLKKTLSYQTQEILANFFNNIPLSKFSIKNVNATANNISGDLGISFDITPTGLNAPKWSYSHLFTGFKHSQPTTIRSSKDGVGLLVTDGSLNINDLCSQFEHSKSAVIAFLNDNIASFIANPIAKSVNGFASTRVIDILPVQDDIYAKIEDGSLLLGQITLSSMLTETAVLDEVPSVKIKVEGFNVNNRTEIYQNEDYITDLQKDKIETTDQLIAAIKDPTSGVVNRLVRVVNGVEGATITPKVVTSDAESGIVTVEFTFSETYDALSNIVKDTKRTYTYQLGVDTKITVVNRFIKIDPAITGKDTYAYLYSVDDLKKLLVDHTTIFNVPKGTNVKILPEINANNATGEITATVRLNKFYDTSGNLIERENDYPVTFYGAMLAGETSLTPVVNTVDISADELIATLTSASISQDELKKYVTVINPSNDPTYPTEITIDPSSVQKVSDTMGIVEAHFSFKNGFTMVGEKLTFEAATTSFWTFRFATKTAPLTTIKPTIADGGISAEGTDLAKATVNNIIENKDNAKTKEFIKKFIVEKQAEIFDNYPTGKFAIDMLSGDMSIALAPNVANIMVTFVLEGAQLPDGIGAAQFTLEIYGLKAVVDETRLHSKVAIGLSNIKGCSSSTYLNDFLNIPDIETLIANAISAEPTTYMLHPVTAEEAASRPYARNVVITAPLPTETQEVRIGLEFLKRADNGSISYASGSFTLTSFNTAKTILLKDRLSVQEDKDIVNALPSEVRKPQIIKFLQPQIEILFEKYPNNFLKSNEALTDSQIDIGTPDDVTKKIPIKLTMHDCYTGATDINHGVGDETFDITLEGFSSTAQPQTTAKDDLNINLLGNNLDMLKPYAGSYVDEIFVNPAATKNAITAFTDALNAHPEYFFVNVPKTSAATPFVKPNTLSIQKKVNLNRLTDIQINAEFYVNAQFVGGTPIYRNMKLIISGFKTESTVFRISSINYPVESFFDLSRSIYYYDVMSSDANKKSFENAIKLKLNSDSSEFFEYLPKCFKDSAIQKIELVPNDRTEQIQVNIVYSGVLQYSDSIPQGTFSDNLQAGFSLTFTSLKTLDFLIKNAIQSVVDEVIVKKNSSMTKEDITPEFISSVESKIKSAIKNSNQYPNFLSESGGWTVDIGPEAFTFSLGEMNIDSSQITIGVIGKKYNYFHPGKLTVSNENLNYKPSAKQLEQTSIIYIIFGVVTAVLIISGAVLGTEYLRSRRTSTDTED